ncbi:protein Flattop isoform 2-T2 [Rhinophrynus dorsalis]
MATYYSANQYESAFKSNNLQNWNVPKSYKECPSTHDGYTQFIASNRGHLLPGVPRSKANPWGTFIGTWDMPTKIPPSKLNLTSRSAEASMHLTDWLRSSDPLISACNGLRPHITGKVLEKTKDIQQSSRGNSREKLEIQPDTTEHNSPVPQSHIQSGSNHGSRASPVNKGKEEGVGEERANSADQMSSTSTPHREDPVQETS